MNEKRVTSELARQMRGVTEASTSSASDGIIKGLGA